MPTENPPALQYAAYPYPAKRNPLTIGQWMMIGAGVFAVTGVTYWGYRTWRRSNAPSANPSHAVGGFDRTPIAGQQSAYPQAA